MKKILLFVALFMMSMFVVGCSKKKVEITLELPTTTLELKVGEVQSINYNVTEGYQVVWSVSKDGIVNVNNGTIEAIAVGEVTVTATVKDTDVKKTITVTVTPVAPTSISIGGERTGKIGETIELTAIVSPNNASYEGIIWTSSDETMATVTDGIVSLLKIGEVTITAQIKNTNIKDEVRILINAIPVTEIIIAGPTKGKVGETITLTATVKPDNATDKTVVWMSNDETVATVEAGVVTLLKPGTAIITARAMNFDTSVTITAEAVPVESITITGKTEGVMGEEIILNATVSPSNATYEAITWSSSDVTTATVDNGVVTLLKPGTVTIKAKIGDIEKTITITVTSQYVAYIGETGYQSLEAAVAAAQANDTIVVKGGTYNKDFTIAVNNLTIMGANNEKAVITAKITIGDNVSGITLKNLEFTDKAQIYTGKKVDNFIFTNNKVYDSTLVASDYKPNNRVDVNAFIQFYTLEGTNIVGNVTITNNTFSNIQANIISIARTSANSEIIISNNSFNNFKLGAIRFDGGYNNGTYKIINNVFANDLLGGFNAILLRAYSPEAGKVQKIYIEDNLFKNIGDVTVDPVDTYPGSAVIATSTFNDNETEIYIRYNTFDHCVNSIHLRNATDATQKWKGYVNYNQFINAIGYVYNETLDLADLKDNLFIDNAGKPIVDEDTLKTLIKNNTKYADYYENEVDYLVNKNLAREVTISLYVDKALKGTEAGASVKVNNVDLVYGTNAFSTIQDALAMAKDNDVIYVASGTYGDAFAINVNNITLLGANYNIDPNTKNRDEEAVITGVISLNKDLKNVTINGFKFEGTSQILGSSVDGITFAYNVVNTGLSYYSTRILGFMELISDSDTNKIKNIMINNNSFDYTNDTAPRLLLGSNIENLYVLNNVMNSSPNAFTDIVRVTGTSLDNTKGTGLSGKFYVYNNEFTNAGQTAIFITKYTNLDTKIINNQFIDIITSAARFRYTGDTEPVSSFTFNFNTLKLNTVTNEYTIAALRIENGADEMNVEAHYNHFTTIPFHFYFTVYEGAIVDARYNFYAAETNFVPNAQKMDKIDDYSEYYTKLEDLPKYGSKFIIMPTEIIVTNPITALEQYEEYRIKLEINPGNTTNTRVTYTSSDDKIASVTNDGKVIAKAKGEVTITITSVADPSVSTTITFEVLEEKRADIEFSGSPAIVVGKTLQLNGIVYGSTDTITWRTSDENIATIDENGLITAIAKGNVTITAELDDETSASIDLVIYEADETDALLQYLIDNCVGIVDYHDILYIGSDDGSADYWHKIYSSVSYYRFSDLETITRKMLANNAPNNSGKDMTSIEWIVIHDTAATPATSDASANAGWATNSGNTSTSWHYTVGNDGIFQQLEDNHVGWHAGDSTLVPLTFTKTDVVANGMFPTVTISEDGYFVINDQKTNVKAPDVNGRTATNADINTNGIRAIVKDGYYYLPNMRYTSDFGGNIAMYGGNLNGIGIETAVNKGSDVWLTWQRTAKLSASLLIKHDLALDRLVTHNHFSGKPCPRTMMTNNLLDEFMHMAEVEYTIQKDYADYTITFTSHNPDLLDNTGRIIGTPQLDTKVSYTITVTNPQNESKSITLTSVIPGARYYQ